MGDVATTFLSFDLECPTKKSKSDAAKDAHVL